MCKGSWRRRRLRDCSFVIVAFIIPPSRFACHLGFFYLPEGIFITFINFTEYIYKPQKMWYNSRAKQTKYTVFGCILLFRDTYTLFWLYSFVVNLIKCKFRTRESINIPNLYIVCLATTGICVFVRWLRSAHFLFSAEGMFIIN